MGTNSFTQTSTHPVLPVRVPTDRCVWRTWMPTGTTGDSTYLESRTNDLTVRIQPITGAFKGISGSAAQGSQTPEALMGAKQASGVPPRSRPV
jgi:hypothetical protein